MQPRVFHVVVEQLQKGGHGKIEIYRVVPVADEAVFLEHVFARIDQFFDERARLDSFIQDDCLFYLWLGSVELGYLNEDVIFLVGQIDYDLHRFHVPSHLGG